MAPVESGFFMKPRFPRFRLRSASWLLPTVLACSGPLLQADAVVEGRIALPKSQGGGVINKRYSIVNNAGVLSTNPPTGVVYVEGDFPPTEPPGKLEIGQKDMVFVPTLLPVRVGSRVEFPNHDDTYHNIFSYSAAKRFDLGRYRPDEKPVPAVVFDQPGLVVLRCDIHEHMRGLVLVLNTPHFVRTDAEGHYRLEGLPAGRYVIKAWIDSRTTLSRPVEIKPGQTLRVELP